MIVTNVRGLAAAAALGVTLAVSACGSSGDPPAAEETPHGYVAGAEEVAEAQSAIAYLTRGARRLHLLDLATGSEREVGLSLGAERITEDGRFVYADDGNRELEVVDAGVWTVDHTDHVHYYRAPARSVGTLTLDAPITTVAGFEAHTTIGTADGMVTVLDRRELEAGKVATLATIDSRSTTALAVPYADQLLVAVGDDPGRPANRIVAMNERGEPTGALEAPCAAPRGWAVLRGGAVIACENSLVRVKLDGEKLTAKTLPSPRGPVPTGTFGYRPRSNEAAVADRAGIWSVNAAKATLRYLPAGGRQLVAAASPADGSTVLALDRSGTLISYDLGTGKVLAQTSVPAANLTLDVDRAYLAEPAARLIHEIDYRDGLRTARKLRVTERPDLVVEVGR
ncbi:hypothetical protein ACN26Y_08565 [Micromonospora sp. WMMD558]|uniref:hypothetical protein n=1 Tax=unclassified Micromonospora TaxID=2617518 RepID=UPI0012B4BFBF|nr:hypothetical protein [Micromonospora sp. WMMC415]QGN46320.1 hypothetical protein GKC29_05370 [Micromonospora sp. WMMC415]